MLVDVIIDVMFSDEFVIIMICLACVLMYALEFVIFGNRKDEDNA